jgi:hypothetical protein
MGLFRPSGFLLCLVPLAIACKSVPSPDGQSAEAAVKEYLGADFETIPSPEKRFILYVQRTSVANPSSGTYSRFMVVNAADGHLVLKESFRPGYVKWTEANVLEILSVPGTLKEGDDLANHIRRVNFKPQP